MVLGGRLEGDQIGIGRYIRLALGERSDRYWERDQIGVGREIRLVLGGRLDGDQIGVGRYIRLVLGKRSDWYWERSNWHWKRDQIGIGRKKNLKIFSLLKIFEPAITVFCEQQGYTPSEILQKTLIVYA